MAKSIGLIGIGNQILTATQHTNVKAKGKTSSVPRVRRPVLIISDLDDTCKNSKDGLPLAMLRRYTQENGPHSLHATRRALKKQFESGSEIVGVYYVTSAPKILEYFPKIQGNQMRWIDTKAFPQGTIVQPSIFGMQSFKTKNIIKLLTQKLEDNKIAGEKRIKVYLYGDSGRTDPEVYAAVVKWAAENNHNIDFHVHIREVTHVKKDHAESYDYIKNFSAGESSGPQVKVFTATAEIPTRRS